MATFNISIPLNQVVDISCPGTPVPNTGTTVTAISYSTSGIVAYQNLAGHTFQLRAAAIGSVVCTVTTKNVANVPFTDTINITVPNPVVDATDSAMTISAPHT